MFKIATHTFRTDGSFGSIEGDLSPIRMYTITCFVAQRYTARFWHIEITHFKRRQANFNVINDFQTIFTGLQSQNAQIKSCI